MYLVYLQSAFAFLLSFGEINIDTVVCDVIPHPSLYFNHFRTWLELHIFHYFVLIHKTLKLKVDVGGVFFSHIGARIWRSKEMSSFIMVSLDLREIHGYLRHLSEERSWAVSWIRWYVRVLDRFVIVKCIVRVLQELFSLNHWQTFGSIPREAGTLSPNRPSSASPLVKQLHRRVLLLTVKQKLGCGSLVMSWSEIWTQPWNDCAKPSDNLGERTYAMRTVYI